MTIPMLKAPNGAVQIAIKLPAWANYIAQDKNGQWWVYENEPSIQHGEWRPNGGNVDVIADEFAYDHDNPVPNWQNTLHQIDRSA